MTQLISAKAQRRLFSHVGFGMFFMLIFSALLPNVSSIILSVLLPGYSQIPWLNMLCNYSLFYLLGYPYACIFLRMRVVGVPPKRNLRATTTLSLLPISFMLMYVGSLIGNFLNIVIGVVSGEMPANGLEETLAQNNPLIIIVFVVLLGPILEELLFRKMLIDVLYPFGEITCVLMSALIFGLIHGNFYQFFYAAFLGGLMALIYCRTGKLIYTVGLHILINFQGSVLAPWILSWVDAEAVSEGNILQMLVQNPFGTLLYYGYSLATLVLGILGLVLFIKKLTGLRLKHSALPLHKPIVTALFNPGMILFLLSSIVIFAINL